MTTEFETLVGDIVPATPEPAADPVAPVEGTPATPVVEGDPTPEPQAPAVETPPAPEPDKPATQTGSVPLPVYMELKHEFNDLRRQVNQMQPGNAPAAPAPPIELPPDPLKVHMDAYTAAYKEERGVEPQPEDIPVPAKVLIERDQWRNSINAIQADQEAKTLRQNAINIASQQTMTDARFGEGLGLDAVVMVGHKFLSEGDKLDIANAGQNCPTVMYRKCLERALQSGTPEGNALAARAQARYALEKGSGGAPVAPAPKPTDPPKPGDPQIPPADPIPSAEEVVGRHPTLARLGLKSYANA